MWPPQPVNKALQKETALPRIISHAFGAPLLLTADVDRVERAVTQAIERWNPATESDDALFRRAIRSVARGTGDEAVAINQPSVAESLLPFELRRVVRLPLCIRPVQTVSYLLDMADDEVRRFTCTGLSQIAADTDRRTVPISTGRTERSSCVPADQVFVKFIYKGRFVKMSTEKQTIVLIHGLWMTARCWEHWVEYYTTKGYRVIARSWPGMEGDIDELRRDPSPIATLGINEIVEHYQSIIEELDRAPIIIGHSFGGLITEVLLDRGLGSAGVAIAPAPVKGIWFLPFSTIKVTFPALSNPANNHRAVPLTPEQFHYAFTNTLSEEESLAVYNRYAVPGPDHILFQAAFANFNPHAATAVDFSNNNRAPLLLLSGGKDHVSPPSVVEANYRLFRKSAAMTAYKEYPERTHYTLGQTGWQEVADDTMSWAEAHASERSITTAIITTATSS